MTSIPSRCKRLTTLLGLVASLGWGASPLDWQSLLGGYPQDLSLMAAKVKVDELVVSRGLQLWEDVELRYQANRADLRKQELGLRLSPSGWGERAANSELNKARRSLGDAHIRQKTSLAILERYKQALDWRFQERQRKYHSDMKELCDRRIEVMSKLVSLPTFDPKDMVEAQVQRIQYLAKIEGDQYSLARIEQRLRLLVPGAGQVSLDGELLTPSEIESTLAQLDGSVSDSFPEIGVAASQLEMERAKTSAEIGSSRRWLSYLEAGYTFDVDENKKERATQRDNIAFGFGVKIPLFDGSSQEIGRRKADLAEVRLKYQDDREDVVRNLDKIRLSIGSMVRQITVLDSFSLRIDAGRLFSEFAMRSGSDPLLLLSARETSLENAWRIEEIRFLMLHQYLEILHLTGTLVRRPDLNHLLAKTPTVSVSTISVKQP